MTQTTLLTKSLLNCGGSCMTASVFKAAKLYPAEKPDNTYVLDNGIRVGKFAQQLFPDAEIVSEAGPIEQAKKTKDLLDYYTGIREDIVICEAGFLHGNLYCATDIVRVREDGLLDIMEVKASQADEKIKDKYYRDVAIQLFIIRKCGYVVNSVSLIEINPEFVKDGDIDPKEFFVTIDVTEHAYNLQDEIKAEVETIQKMLINGDEPRPRINDNCFHSDCPFWNTVCKFVPQRNSIFEIRGMTAAKKLDFFYNKGVMSMEDYLKTSKPNPRFAQQCRVEVEKDDNLQIDYPALREFLSTIDPSKEITSMDFETLNEGKPMFNGQKSYAQTPFQFSLHVLNRKGDALQHYEYLARPDKDWRVEFAHELVKSCATSGAVIVWNDDMEGKRIEELIELPGNADIKDALQSIKDRIVDLMDVFRKRIVYQREMRGSFSVKHVLPALFPNNERLSYGTLAVNNGAKAQEVFARLIFDKDVSDLDVQASRQELLEYCGLDTLGPMYILELLFQLVDPYFGELFKKTEKIDQAKRNILVGDKVATDRGNGEVTGFTKYFVRVSDGTAKYLRRPHKIYDLSGIDHNALHHSDGSFAPFLKDETGTYKNCFVDAGGDTGRFGALVIANGKLGKVVGRTNKFLKIQLPNGKFIYRKEYNVTLVK